MDSSNKCTEIHQKNLQNYKNPAFVLGNGTSRQSIDPVSICNAGTVYGCNAQYREFEPDHLIAVDVKMINEIIDAGYNVNHSVWTNPSRGIKSKQNLNIFKPHKGWSSGPTALWLASTYSHPEIYILGFDYKGLDGKLNNVYADTQNYKKSSDHATYYGNWLNQTIKVISEFKHITYYRVIQEGNFIPPRLTELSNIKHINYTELTDKYANIVKMSRISGV